MKNDPIRPNCRIIFDENDKMEAVLTGNLDLSGDIRVEWIEGDTDGHEVRREAIVPGRVLQAISRHLEEHGLAKRMEAYLHEK